MGKFNNRVALGALDKDQCVVTEMDMNVAGKPTGYWLFIQDDRYAVDLREAADVLRRNGYLVDNRFI